MSLSSPGAVGPGKMHAASSRISRAVLRSCTRQELLDAVVRILVEHGGFAVALASWYDPAGDELKPVARFGDGAVCGEAAAIIPISLGGAPCGMVSAYARERWTLGAAEEALCAEIAGDVSLGLDRLEAEEKRRLAEAALALREQRLQLAMEAAAIGTYEWDMITGQVEWDERSQRLFGYEYGSFDGSYAAFASRVHPDDLPGVEQIIADSIKARTPYVHEFRIVWPDGSVHWISSRGEFTLDAENRPVRLYGATFEISDRKRAEAALRQSEERWRQAVRVSGIGTFEHDHMEDTIYWSPQMRAIHRLDAETTVTLEVYYSLVHPDDRERIAQQVRRAHDPAGDGLFDVENRLLLADGSVRWTRTRSQTFFEGQGERRHLVRTVGAVTDITEWKGFEEELKKLASVVEMSNEFIGIATPDGRVVYLNNAAMQLVGIENIEEARRKSVFDFVSAAKRREAVENIYPTLLKEGSWSGESQFRHFRTGVSIEVDLTAFQIRDDRGLPLYIATVARDITERKKAALEKARWEAGLQQAQKMESIGRLAGGVAHDFNNMLTVILGFARLAMTRIHEPDTLRRHLDEIAKAAERSRQITEQLLGFSRQQIIAPRPSDLNSIVEDLRSPLARLIGEDIELCFHPESKLWKALLDSSQVNQILLNLAVNARDAMPNGGRLTIETANVRITEEEVRSQANCTPGEYVMVAVSDTGSGMSRDTQAHIFEPFFTTKERGQGTGLGLATVYGIVKQNEGFVNVDSEVDQGTTFRIHFPRLAGEGESSAPLPAPVPTGAGSVLVVEDDDLVREVTTAALESIGYTPLVASSAQEALLICEQSGPGIRLILTDVVMAGMSGTELRDRISVLRPDIEVLFMSGYTSNMIVTHGVLKKGIHFIQKPFSIEELGRKIAEILGSAG